jgi:hypothetical protein
MLNAITKNLQPVVPPAIIRGQFFNPPTGVYDTNQVFGNTVYQVFQQLVTCMSDGLIDFASTYFEFDLSQDGEFLLVANGEAIRNRGAGEIVVSFEDLYTALHRKLNLCMIFEKQANGRPLIRIEQASFLTQQGASVNLYDQPDITLGFDKDRLYSAVTFGSSPMLEAENCTNGTCTFSQTPFRGFRDETFGFTGECNSSSILDLNSKEIVFDTNVIEDVFRFNSTERKLDTFIVQCNWIVAQNQYYAQQFDPYTLGQTVYNGDLRNINVSANWINGYPNSLYSFLNVPPSPALADLTALSNYNVPGLPFFVVDDGAFTDFIGYNGFPVPFTNEIFDVNNNFDGQTYTAPYLGTYTVSAYVILDGITATGSRDAFISIIHLNSQAQIINTYDGPVLTKANIDPIISFLSENILMNEGDLIRINVSCELNTSGPPLNQALIDQAVEGGILYGTSLQINAIPFQSNNPDEELQAVNIDDVRAYIYSFDRPLRMEEIEAILDNTSRPIKFGQFDDPLRVIEGYINKVDIKSIIKQDASIQLKSNKILR